MDKDKYQTYINNFRRRLTPALKPGIGLSCNIFPSEDGGAILEFTMGNATENDDEYKDVSESLGVALSNIEQKAFGGNLSGFNFGGTNTILENNRIIYIKEAAEVEWGDSAAQKDVADLFSKPQRVK